MSRTAQCDTCPATFKANDRGPIPKRCPACKAGKATTTAPKASRASWRDKEATVLVIDNEKLIGAALLELVRRFGLSSGTASVTSNDDGHVIEVRDDLPIIVRLRNPFNIKIEPLQE